MICSLARILLLALLATALTRTAVAQTQSGPTASQAAIPALTPEQARQALDVLLNEQKRTALVKTLEPIAAALPAGTAQAQPTTGSQRPAPAAAARKPAKKAPIPLAPNSLGMQVFDRASAVFSNASVQISSTARAVTDFPRLWRWLEHMLSDPTQRMLVFSGLGRLAIILGGAAIAWFLMQRWVRRPLASVEAKAEIVRTSSDDHTDARRRTPAARLLRRLPLVAARLALDLLPLVAFALVGNLLLSTPLGGVEAARAAKFVILDAAITAIGIMIAVRFIVVPNCKRLRLLRVSDQAAAYIEIWARRIVIVAVFGSALAEAAQLLGLAADAYQSLLKITALLVHLFAVVIVLQCRRDIAERIHAPPGSHGMVAVFRNRLAAVWHWIAIFYIVAFWVVWALEVRNGVARLIHFFFITVLVLILARVLGIVALGALDRIFRINPDVKRRFPGLEARANRYYPLLRGIVSAVVLAVTAIALLQAWGIDAFGWFSGDAIGGRLLSALVTVGVTIIIAVAVWEGVNAATERHLAHLTAEQNFVRVARLRTLVPMFRTTLLVIILLVIALTALSEVGVNIGPLLAGAGIVGIAIGFGSQKLVQDLITGIFLLLENTMQVGDWVTVSGLSGSVENLSIRTIRLRAGDGSVHIIPFSSVTSVTNTNRGVGNAPVNVTVAYEEDTDRVGEILRDIVAGMRADDAFTRSIMSDFQLWGVDKVEQGGVTIVGQIVCTDTGRWSVQREFNRRMKKRFSELGISLALNTQKVVVDAFQAGHASETPGPKREVRSG